jgi:hypothetical protein
MLKQLIEDLEEMKTGHEIHRDRLKKWKNAEGQITGFENQTIADLIQREEKAIAELSRLIKGK